MRNRTSQSSIPVASPSPVVSYTIPISDPPPRKPKVVLTLPVPAAEFAAIQREFDNMAVPCRSVSALAGFYLLSGHFALAPAETISREGAKAAKGRCAYE